MKGNIYNLVVKHNRQSLKKYLAVKMALVLLFGHSEENLRRKSYLLRRKVLIVIDIGTQGL